MLKKIEKLPIVWQLITVYFTITFVNIIIWGPLAMFTYGQELRWFVLICQGIIFGPILTFTQLIIPFTIVAVIVLLLNLIAVILLKIISWSNRTKLIIWVIY